MQNYDMLVLNSLHSRYSTDTIIDKMGIDVYKLIDDNYKDSTRELNLLLDDYERIHHKTKKNGKYVLT